MNVVQSTRSAHARSLSRMALAGLFAVLSVASVGCAARGLGDPCIPESIPAGGFNQREVYVETSAVQCRTRVCMVYQLQGNPEHITGTPSCGANPDCVSQELVNERVFCSCRCSAGGDTNTPLCACNEGFTCVDDVVNAGGVGVRGGYCVRSDLVAAE